MAKLRTIALPKEHGGWGFLLEPIVLGLILAPTVAGVFFGLAAASAFLARQPIKVFARHHRTAGQAKRVRLALGVAVFYGVLAVTALVAAVEAAGWEPAYPFLLLSPFTLIFVFYDSQDRMREAIPELAGPLGLAATASSIALASGWQWPAAMSLWGVMVARALPSIVYIRARLRLEKGRPIRGAPVGVVHGLFGFGTALLAWAGWVPVLAVGGFAMLWLRATLGLSTRRRLRRAKHIGISELGFGLLYIGTIVVGDSMDW